MSVTGIGAAIAKRFAESGTLIAVTGRRAGPIEKIAREFNGLAIPGDTTKSDDCDAAVKQTIDRFGRLDIVIANAGIMSVGNVVSQTLQEWHKIMDINISGVMQIARAAIPAMIDQGKGSIVNISSVAGLSAGAELTGYVTSKHAVTGLTKSMAIDYGKDNIRVNTFCPGWIRTPMSEEEMATIAANKNISVQEALDLTVKYLPLQRMAEPDEIATCAEFLASDDDSFVTGITLVADGGGECVDVGSLSFLPQKYPYDINHRYEI